MVELGYRCFSGCTNIAGVQNVMLICCPSLACPLPLLRKPSNSPILCLDQCDSHTLQSDLSKARRLYLHLLHTLICLTSTYAAISKFRQIDQLPKYAARQLSKRPSFQAMIAPLSPALVMFPVYDAGPCTSISTVTLSVTPGGKYRE